MKKLSIVLVTLIISAMFLMTGCTSKVVPPGTIVMVLKASGEGKVSTKGSYRAWGRDRVYFVDVKLKSFTEKMAILCKDKVNLTVEMKWIGSFDVSKDKINIIKTKVPAIEVKAGDIKGYQLKLEGFYIIAMRDIIRSITRSVIAEYITDSVPDNRELINAEIKDRIIKRLVKLNYPVSTADVLLSNLDFDEQVTKTRKDIKSAELSDQKKAAEARAEVAQAKRDVDIARERGKASVEAAKAKATVNRIISDSLDDKILFKMQIDALLQAASGPNNELIVIPYDALKIMTPAIQRSTINKMIKIQKEKQN